MNTEFRKSFIRDLKKNAANKKLIHRVREVILQVEESEDIYRIQNLKKLAAEGDFYRIRVGDYRIGPVIENNSARFVRLLDRKDMYRYFP